MAKDSNKSILSSVAAPPSLREMVYRAIKEAIMSKTLKRGEIYSEHGLAAQLGISKTPVHEAILDLESRGFVTLVPRKGIIINELTAGDIRDLYEFRLVIETAALKKVGARLKEKNLQWIREVHQNCIKATQADDHLEYIKWDREFHIYLVSLTNNSYLTAALENVRDLIDWMGVRAMYRPDRLMEVDQEHGAVLEMLEKGDAKNAARLMAEHIRETERNALAGWSQNEKARDSNPEQVA